MRNALVLMLLALAPACDRPEPAATRRAPPASPPARPAAAYERRLAFLAGSASEPMAALFEFRAADTPRGLHRIARGWLADDSVSAPVLDLSWDMAPMREPWRLVPRGPLRLVVAPDDELEALVVRAEPRALSLRPGRKLAEWSSGAGIDLVLRRAELVEGREPGRAGTLYDVRIAVPTPADTSAGAEAFLSDGRDLHLILAGGGGAAWLRRNGRLSHWTGAQLTGGADTSDTAATSWHVRVEPAGLTAELRALPASSPGDTAAAGRPPRMVRGWVEVNGRRQAVFGILRGGRP